MYQLSDIKNKWIILILSFLPLFLCLPCVENLIAGSENGNFFVKNSLFSYGIVCFLLIFILSILCRTVDYLDDFKSYVSGTDGKIHVASFFICALFLVHFYCSLPFLGDDVAYKASFEHKSIAESIQNFYQTTSPTFIIHSLIFALINRSLWYWRLLNVLVVLFGAECAIQIAVPKDKRKFSGIVYLLFFLIPQAMYSDAGWCATTLNYVWPISISLFIIFMLKKHIEGCYIDLFTKTISVFLLIFACNSIQCSICLFPLLCIVLAYEVLKEKGSILAIVSYLKSKPFIGILCVVAFCCLLSNTFCPGNSVRYGWSVTTYYPTFNELSLFDKLELGFVNMMANLNGIAPHQYIALPLFLSLLFLLWSKRDKINYVMLFLVVCTVFILYLSNKLGINTFDLLRNKEVQSLSAFSCAQVHFEAIVYIAFLCVFSYCVFRNISNVLLAALAVLLIVAAVVSGVLMGFSPTIYASGMRTLLLSSVCFLLSASILFFEAVKESDLKDTVCGIFLLASSFVVLIISLLPEGTIKENQPIEQTTCQSTSQNEQNHGLNQISFNPDALNACLHVEAVNGVLTTAANQLTVDKKVDVQIEGWAYDPQAKKGLDSLYVLVGDRMLKTEYGSDRPDVKQTLNLTGQKVGFKASLPIKNFEQTDGSMAPKIIFLMKSSAGDYYYPDVTYNITYK